MARRFGLGALSVLAAFAMVGSSSAVRNGLPPSSPASPYHAPALHEWKVKASWQTPPKLDGVSYTRRLADGTWLLSSPADAERVRRLPGVEKVEPAPVASVLAAPTPPPPNDPFFRYEWWMQNTGFAYGQAAVPGDDVRGLAAWSLGSGASAVVAVIDTGVVDVPDLAGRIWTNPKEPCGATRDLDGDGLIGDCHGWNFYTGSPILSAGWASAHGTGVSSVIAAAANDRVGIAGLIPNAKIMPLVVSGDGYRIAVDLVPDAVRYAVDHGANAINMSFGGSAFSPSECAAIHYAISRGVPVVAAAGNAHTNNDVTPTYPANCPGVVSVGAVDPSFRPASFTNYGRSVTIFAPGVSIVGAVPGGYAVFDGTSLAAPMVAATLAELRTLDRSATVSQLVARLLAGARLDPALQKLTTNPRVLDVQGALLQVRPAGPPQPVRTAGYRFTGLGTPRSTITVAARGNSNPTALALRLLAKRGSTFSAAAARVPVTVGRTVVVTDEGGWIAVPLSTQLTRGTTFSISVNLPSGQWAWYAQLVDRGGAVGRPALAPFAVARLPRGARTSHVVITPSGGTAATSRVGARLTAVTPTPFRATSPRLATLVGVNLSAKASVRIGTQTVPVVASGPSWLTIAVLTPLRPGRYPITITDPVSRRSAVFRAALIVVR
ncbi:MAG: S8 family serine peptidase [Acidothermus sp.]|nr:S8 family serine peptidase [Acidothermus sp.]MCL6538510.1 S8 family serine peptidase [Acidothermus sp.]